MNPILQKLRSVRICSIAIFDLVVAFLGMGLIGIFITDNRFYLLMILALTIPLGILVHYALGIPTRLNYLLGLSDDPLAFGQMPKHASRDIHISYNFCPDFS